MNTIVPSRPDGRAHEFHPFAAIWPLMDGEDFEKFAADIKSNGLHLPIVLYQGKILDGRNRYRACIAADFEPHFEDAKAANDDEGA